MPDISPSGGMSLTIDAVANCFANCPTWHEWTEYNVYDLADRAGLSKKRIYFYSLPKPENPEGYSEEELQVLRPAIGLTYIPPSWTGRSSESYSRDRTSYETFTERATVYAHVVSDVSDSEIDDTAYYLIDFTNKLGALIDEVLMTGDIPDCSYVQRVSVILEPNRVNELHKGTQGDFVHAMLKIEVGV